MRNRSSECRRTEKGSSTLNDDLIDQLRRAILGQELSSVVSGVVPSMLDIRPQRGSWLALPYRSLAQVEYQPDGKPPLRLEFGSHTVDIEGSNLEGVYLAVVGQRATIISEVDGLHVDEHDEVPNIERIVVRKQSKRQQAEAPETASR